MAERVTNEAVAVALRGLGFDIGQIDMTGAQNSTWKRKVLAQLRGRVPAGQFPDDIFNQAIATAKKIKDIPVDASPVDRLSQTLSAYGVKGAQYTQIVEEAKRIKSADRGLRDRTTPFDVRDYAQAAVNVLGHTGAVLDSLSNAGIRQPPPPAPGSAGAKVTAPVSGPSQAPLAGPSAAPVGSVRHTVQRGGERTPGVKPPATAAAAAGAGAGAGAGTGRGTATQGAGAGAGAGAGGGFDTTPALGAGASDDAVRAYVKKHYGQYAWMLDVPDIAAVMRQAAEKGWEAEEVTGAMTATDWWKKTEPAARLWTEQSLIDPANTADQIRKQTTLFRNQALGLGINVPAAELSRLAEESLKFGWDENEQRAALGQFYKYDDKNLLGAAQATSNHIKQAAKDWMVPLDAATLATWTEKVIRGEATTDYFDTYLAGQAKSLYPQLEDPISRGINPSQWMAPYKSIAADTLGLKPDDIDLREGKWMRAINQVDEKGGRSAMTLYDWENLIKTDDSYGFDKTQKGRDHGASLARNIAAQFGFATGGGL